MDIKGTTRVCGLIGNPVGHSVSPAIHNNLAQLTGKDMVYTTFKVEKGDVASAVRGAYSLNILGLNVTVPHKSEVIDSLVDIDPLAKAIGAVNTLVRVDGGFKGTTRVCGLIGNPVGHSVSPAIHNNLAQLTGKDMVYTTFKVEKGDVASAVRGAYSLNILGLNVTVPHKSEVIDSLVDIDPLAKAIGAVNTLVRVDGGFKGYNTDILGLARELEDEGIELADSKVIILGAGGAARAITFLCSSKGAKKIYLLNRSVDKAQDIAHAVNTHFHNEKVIPMNIADYADIPGDDYIVIQTTSVGLHPNDTAVVIDDEAFYKKAAVGVDIIYNPGETMFMKLIKAQGKKAYNGLKMLLYQGVSAYELWNDCKITKEEADEVYKCLQKELGINE